MTKLITALIAFLNAISTALNYLHRKNAEAKYEEARNDIDAVIVDGFGVRKQNNSDPSSSQ